MERKYFFCICLICTFLISSSILTAQVPQQINYQGYLTDTGGNPIEGNLSMEFKIYDTSTSGTALWSESHATVTVTNGYFNVLLGSITLMPNQLFDGAVRYLGITVGSDTEMTPRKQMVSVGFSFHAAETDSLVGFNPSEYVQTIEGVSPDAGNVDLIAGSNITITPDAGTHTITIAATEGGNGDITTVNAGEGLSGGADSGDVSLDVSVGPGLSIVSDTVQVDDTTLDGWYVNENQANSVTTDMMTPDVISSIDGVSNDGGNVDLVEGSNITITSNDETNTITISATPGGGGGDITSVVAGNGLSGGATSGDATLNVNAGNGLSIASDVLQVNTGTGITTASGSVELDLSYTDNRYVNGVAAGNALTGGIASGVLYLDVLAGTGLVFNSDVLEIDQTYTDGRYVNENQGNSVTASMITPDVISSLNSVTNDGGNINLTPGTNIKINAYDATDQISIGMNIDRLNSIDGVSNAGGNVDLVEGSNITITPDDGANTITISASGSGDNLGDHTATQNIELNGHWLSGDGDSYEGVFVNSSGDVYIGSGGISGYRLSVMGAFATTSNIKSQSGYICTGSPTISFGAGDIAATDDLYADGSIIASGGYIRTGAPTQPSTGNGDITADDDIRADDLIHAGGNITCDGTKSSILTTTTFGKRKFYAEEATEVYFVDRGQAQLINGEVTIYLDPIFKESVTIDANNPMLVQVTLTDDCNGVFVTERTPTSFKVQELMGGTSNATFNWEVCCKRKGYETVRLTEWFQNTEDDIPEDLEENNE